MADVIVVGAGISGLGFAWQAARAGRTVEVLEQGPRLGGCIHTLRRPDGFWFELGAHTTYATYGAFLDLAGAAGATGALVPRGEARKRFGLLRAGSYTWLTPPRVLLALDWLEAAAAFPSGILRKKAGETVYSYYARLIGRRNYDRVLSPFLEAVPSQKADGFPAEGPGSLFKRRPRRKGVPRSYGFEGGLQTVCERVAAMPGISVETGVEVVRVRRDGAKLAVRTADGRTRSAPVVAVAVPAARAVALVQDDFHELADAIAKVRTVEVESLGVVLPRARCWMPEVAFVVPVDDLFHSAVTRDPFPHPELRAFAFHFRPGLAREARVRRMAEVLRVTVDELGPVAEARAALPSPALGHGEVVAEIDRCLAGGSLALTGNYFAGLAIEDCVGRSVEEWGRVARGG